MNQASPPFSLLAILALVSALAGCENYARPYRPVPRNFQAQYLDGSALSAADLAGSPTVLNLWVPG
jgi:hypothetical protein